MPFNLKPMKNFPTPRGFVNRSGFTLVELLVVIVIIAILAASLTVAAGSAIRAAKRAQAANLATQIQTAAMNYYTEYSVYPVPASTTTDNYISDSDATDWKALIQSLCGGISPSNPAATVTLTVTNTRSIAFLTLKATDVDANDAPKNPLSYDSTGAHPYFNLVIDSDYDGIAGDSGTVPTVAPSGMPNFATFVTGTPTWLTKGTTGGIAVWANCNTTTTTTKWNPGFFVHTY
jgi:prepilin-type N-terminal cleavage/methylation domain-containing protein